MPKKKIRRKKSLVGSTPGRGKEFEPTCSFYRRVVAVTLSRCQFHQRFSRAFFVRKCFSLVTFWQQKALLYQKRGRKTLMKLALARFVDKTEKTFFFFTDREIYEVLFSSRTHTHSLPLPKKNIVKKFKDVSNGEIFFVSYKNQQHFFKKKLFFTFYSFKIIR